MNGQSPSLDNVDYDCCPVPKTHRCLVEAHLLWHQCMANYQDPEPFRANLSALIQALRNITWVLQSEKHTVTDFDNWYRRKQEQLRAHRVSKWLIEARNMIVKRGELDASSFAKIRLITWQDRVLAELAFPPDCPSPLILSNLCLVGLANNVGIPLNDLRNATVSVERRWTVADLGDVEILEALAQVYSLLSEIVLDAHQQMQAFACISRESQHPHFFSRYHRTDNLDCMAFGVAQRTNLFELAGEQELMLRRVSSSVDLELGKDRYGFRPEESITEWESLDPLLVAEKCLYRAKRILQKDKYHERIVMVRDGAGVWHLLTLKAANRAEKYSLMQFVARYAESLGADAIIDISEMWVVPKDVAAKLGDPDLFDKAPGRMEELYLFVATREGKTKSYHTPFSRGPFGGIKLSDTVSCDGKHWPPYMTPVIDVWRRQGVIQSPDGETITRLWEPDPLGTCFCGGEKRFAECCKPLLAQFNMAALGKNFDEAAKSSDFTLVEVYARAAIAQYVIWIRQHTVPMMHTGGEAYEAFVGVDLPALEDHTKRLAAALSANQRRDDFLKHLRSIRGLVGIPEINVHLVGLSAQWLSEKGEEAAAIKELSSLGDMERINDALVLGLAAQLLDIPKKIQQSYFKRAISNARSLGEKTSLKLEFIRNSLRGDNNEDARSIIESLIAEQEFAKADDHTRAETYFYRWTITQDEGDWKLALTSMRTLADEETHLATMLIQHGDIEEAANVLSKRSQGQDLSAQLLLIEVRLRLGQIDEAHRLLLDMDEPRLPANYLFPFAATYAQIALARDDPAMKSRAAERLTSILPSGRETTSWVNALLKELSESDSGSRAVMSRFRNLLRGPRLPDHNR
jgi:hypothetical protein